MDNGDLVWSSPTKPDASVRAEGERRPESSDSSIPGVTIRTLNPNDLDNLRQLDKLLFPVTYSDSFYHNLLANPNLNRVAVNADREIVGCVTCRYVRYKQYGRSVWVSTIPQCVGYISTLGVSPNYRRRGLGKRLLEIALEELSKECNTVILHVKADNTAAIQLYLNAGFVRVKYLPNHYLFDNQYHDAIQLQRGQCDTIHSLDSALDHEDDGSWLSWAPRCTIF